MTTKMKQK